MSISVPIKKVLYLQIISKADGVEGAAKSWVCPPENQDLKSAMFSYCCENHRTIWLVLSDHRIDVIFLGGGGGGLHKAEVAYLLLTQQPQARFSAFSRLFLLMLLRLIDGTAYNSGQRLDNVDRTHLVLVSGKLGLQKYLSKMAKFQLSPDLKNGSTAFLHDAALPQASW